MSQTYTFPIPAGKSATELLEKAKAEGRSKRIAFTGDEKSGRFQGVAEGSYAVEGGQLTVVVDKKPAFIPWMVIENALKGLFAGG